MKLFYRKLSLFFMILVLLTCFGKPIAAEAMLPFPQQDTIGYILIRGVVSDQHTGQHLAFASITVKGSNVSTVSNTEGSFLLKVPGNLKTGLLEISFLSYKTKQISLSNISRDLLTIELEPLPRVLPEVSIVFNDAESLVREVLRNKGTNYSNEAANVTAFYRETIRKRKTYISLLEAVVDVYKYPYTSDRSDWVSLYKVRKNSDYQKLDTLAFKLMGGPYNTLMTDVMKNSDDFFDTDIIREYSFTYEGTVQKNDKQLYIVSFKQVPTYKLPLYFGKLYIDAEKLALVSAEYGVNLENREAAIAMFIKKRPVNAKVYPIRSTCRVDYQQRGDKWYLSYCRVELDVYINWKKKLFNTTYASTMEMAVTDWSRIQKDDSELNPENRMKPSTIIADKVTGFADPDFWGQYNVIEPEKPIQTAIRKIQKQLNKK